MVTTTLEELTEEYFDLAVIQGKVERYPQTGLPNIGLPNIKYDSILENPNTPVEGWKTIGDLLGITEMSAKNNLAFGSHTRILNESGVTTTGLLELYAYSRAKRAKKPAEKRKSELKETLRRISGYGKSLYPLHPESLDVPHTEHEKTVVSSPVAEALPKTEYDPRHVFSYNSCMGSEFARQLNVGDIKEGAFIYHHTIKIKGRVVEGEVGILEKGYEKGEPRQVAINFPDLGLRSLVVNQEESYPPWDKDIHVPEGIRLPDGTIYTSKSDSTAGATEEKVVQAVPEATTPHLEQIAQSTPVAETAVEAYGEPDQAHTLMDNIVGREFVSNKLYDLLGLGRGKEAKQEIRKLNADGLLPNAHGTYDGLIVARYAHKRGLDRFFRQQGYEGDRATILRTAGIDLEAMTDGGNKKQPVQRVEAAVTKSKYEFYGEHGAAYRALVEQKLPGDDIALGMVADLTQGPRDSNYVYQELHKKLNTTPDKISATLDLLTEKKLVTMNKMAELILDPAVLTPV